MVAFLIKLLTGAHARWVVDEHNSSHGAATQKRIYFANHSSNLDAPVIWASLPAALRARTRPVAAKDYWDAGPIRRFLAKRVFRVVLIERKKVTARSNPLAEMEKVLDNGESLIIFPEGGRAQADDEELLAFKPGLFHLARKHPDVQLVPVYLENLSRILPKGGFIVIPLIAAVTFGLPIQLRDGESKQEFLDRAKAAIDQLSERTF